MVWRKQVNKIVGVKDGEIYFLEEVFRYDDGFKGATGLVLRPIPKEEYEEATTEEALREEFREIWVMAVENGSTDAGLDEWIRESRADLIDSLFEPAPYTVEQKVREELGYTPEEYPVIAVVGGGRVFDCGMEFDKVLDPAAVELIRKFEC